jgi:hypothetical protein
MASEVLSIEAFPIANGAMEAKKSVCRFCVKKTRLDKFIVTVNQFLSILPIQLDRSLLLFLCTKRQVDAATLFDNVAACT